MTYRTRINYTAEQKSEMWDRWQRGESLNSIGRVFDRPSSSIFGQLAADEINHGRHHIESNRYLWKVFITNLDVLSQPWNKCEELLGA